MTYHGRVKNGVVVLEDDAALADGTRVRIQPVREPSRRKRSGDTSHTLGQRLMRFAGRAKGLPRDMARNHDHYIYGAPKK